MSGWIGVDLDGTIAMYPVPIDTVGEPIPLMVERVKQWLAEGIEVRIVTARVGQCDRVNPDGVADDAEFARRQRLMIEQWCLKHIGRMLRITASKDFEMMQLWDDRAVEVKTNTGMTLMESLMDRTPK